MTNLDKNLPLKLVIIAIVILSLSQFISNKFQTQLLDVFRSPLKIVSGIYYVLKDVTRFKQLENENKVLKENVLNLENELLKLQEISLENRRLKNLLDFKGSEDEDFIPAMVIGRDILLGLRDTIIIDKGRRQGVYEDMSVITGNGLVGRVRECGHSISKVLLISDYDSAVGAIIQRTRDMGLIVGNMREGLLMKYLAVGCDVKKGDKVITSGFSGIFKKGFLIGEVVYVEKDESGLYLNAVLKPEVDMMKLEEVLVVR